MPYHRAARRPVAAELSFEEWFLQLSHDHQMRLLRQLLALRLHLGATLAAVQADPLSRLSAN
ncbi:MAG TPA: hypothetical protein VNK95_10395 [Caldilineaceae bacterium]|nr:hypothetical protein [Caldilineaceae bacterium]